IALVLLREAAELRRQAEKDGVRAYLEKPNVRHRPNSQQLSLVLNNIGVNELTEGDHDTDRASVTCSMSYMVEVGKNYCVFSNFDSLTIYIKSLICASYFIHKETGTSLQTLTSAATMERLGGGNIVQPSLSTRDALDKYHIVTQKYSEVPEIILRCISRDEAALAIAQTYVISARAGRPLTNNSNNLSRQNHVH
ncbi:unnamed protein product, partial [Brassica napus]